MMPKSTTTEPNPANYFRWQKKISTLNTLLSVLILQQQLTSSISHKLNMSTPITVVPDVWCYLGTDAASTARTAAPGSILVTVSTRCCLCADSASGYPSCYIRSSDNHTLNQFISFLGNVFILGQPHNHLLLIFSELVNADCQQASPHQTPSLTKTTHHHMNYYRCS